MQLLRPQDDEIKEQNEHNIMMVDYIKKHVQRVFDSKCQIMVNQSYKQVSLFFLLNTEYEILKYKMQVRIHFDQGYVLYKCRILKNNVYIILRSNEIRINYLHKHLFSSCQQATSTVNLDNGEMFVSSTSHYLSIIQHKQLMTKQILIQCRQLVKEVNQKISNILRSINEDVKMSNFYDKDSKYLSNQQQKRIAIERVKKFINFSQVDLGLSQKSNQYSTPSQQIVDIRNHNLKKVEIESYETQNYLLQQKSNTIFIHAESTRDNMKITQRQFQDSKVLQNLLKIQSQRKEIKPEDSFICNQIQIDDLKQYAVYKKSQNSIVKMCDMIFRKILDQNIIKKNGITIKMALQQGQIPEVIDQKKPYRQMILIKDNLKIQITKRQSEDKALRQRIERINTTKYNKIVVQRKIIQMFNSAKSQYFIKYYFSQQPQHKHKLIMGFANNTSFSQHLTKNRYIISLNSKLILFTHISNALRFMRYYKITHMDLNPNNVLVSETHIPKIIDFGQAFHQKLITGLKIKYQPGFTLPYTAPQFFTQNTFGTSYDMFSFGMIIFAALFNYFPLPHHNQKLMQYELKHCNYQNRLFLAPEAIYEKGKPQVMFLLLKLINKCFSSRADLRPLPVWTTVILKKIIQLNNK